MIWKEYTPESWADLRALLTDFGSKGSLSCRGDPGGHADVRSSIDLAFQEAGVSEGARPALERFVLGRFYQQAACHLPTYQLGFLENALQSLILMRHHGGPTRLVDWTGSVWIAAFFAVQREVKKQAVIWLFDRHAYQASAHKLFGHETPQALLAVRDQDGLEYPRVFYPQSDPPLSDWVVHLLSFGTKFPRLIVQQGHFTLGSRLGLDHAQVIDSILQQGGTPECIPHSKILVGPSIKREALLALEQMGITGASMFPGIDGVCAHLCEFVRFGDLDLGVQRLTGIGVQSPSTN